MGDYQSNPNQQKVYIRRIATEAGKYLSVDKESLRRANITLTPTGRLLFLYFVGFRDETDRWLSPVHIENTIGLPQGSYYKARDNLIEHGYLVQNSSNAYIFYEMPMTKPKEETDDFFKKEKKVSNVIQLPQRTHYTFPNLEGLTDDEIIAIVSPYLVAKQMKDSYNVVKILEKHNIPESVVSAYIREHKEEIDIEAIRLKEQYIL